MKGEVEGYELREMRDGVNRRFRGALILAYA